MDEITLQQAQTIADAALAHARRLHLNPMTVAIVDTGGCLKLLLREDGLCPTLRPDVAKGKARAAVLLGPVGSRHWQDQFGDRPGFVQSLMHMTGGDFLPGAGGVAILSNEGEPLGAIGCSGDLPDNDEAIAIEGVHALGLIAQPDTPAPGLTEQTA